MANLMHVAKAATASPISVAVLTSLAPSCGIKVQRAFHELISSEVEADQVCDPRWGYRGARVYLKNGSSIRFSNQRGPEALYGCLFDLIAFDDQVHPEVLVEAKKRLISNLSSVEGETNV